MFLTVFIQKCPSGDQKYEKCKNNAAKIGKGLLNSQQGGRPWGLGE
jgi:hypothetical protein